MTCSKCGRTGYESHAKLEEHSSRQCRTNWTVTYSYSASTRFDMPPDALKKLKSVEVKNGV